MRQKIEEYIKNLEYEEKSPDTCSQYRRDVLCFFGYAENSLEKNGLTKELVIQYKSHLQERYKDTSVNAKLSALNSFFTFLGRQDLKVKQLRIQKSPFCSGKRELSKKEYMRLIKTAQKKKNKKLALIQQTLCGTGIRVSELRFITVEAVKNGEVTIRLKGKTRVILIPGKLRRRLQDYIRKNQTVSGPVFITKTGKPVSRTNIWRKMKDLSKEAGVDSRKVFPHNLRHLFARTFYAIDKDIAKLADILGHSSIETTRIYTMTSGREHRRKMDALGLVV